MSVEISKIITEAPLKVHGAVGIGVGGTAGTSLMLDLVSSWLIVTAAALGIVVTTLSLVSLVYRIRQDRIKVMRGRLGFEKDQLELEMYRKQIRSVAQKDQTHK